MREKFNRFLFQLSYLPRALKLVWTPTPGWTIAWTILLIIQGILPAVTIYLTGILVDSIVDAIALEEISQSIEAILVPSLLMGSSAVLSMLCEESINWISTAQSEVVGDYIQGLVHQKSVEADLAFYESPDYYNRLEQTQSNARTHPLELVDSLGQLVQNTITAIGIVFILLPYGVWISLILLLSTTPAFFVVLHFNRRYHRWWYDSTIDRRWANYYSSMLTSDFVAPELRLFDLGDNFQSAYQNLRQTLRVQLLNILRAQALVRLAAKSISLLIGAIPLGWMLLRALKGILTIGDLALFYQAFNRGQGLMRSFLGSIGQIYRSTLFLENLFEFLDWQPSVIEPTNLHSMPLLNKEIRFRRVSFRYPGSETYVFQNLDLVIPAGKTIAIVGDNGAGKSTLLKLLCRFYEPETGAIEIDGVDLRHLCLRELRDSITVLFQFPVRYQATVKDNIAYGNLAFKNNDASDRHKIKTAAIAAGAHEFITQLPQDYNTLLSKSLAEGSELSGGEWQRIALARAFLRQSPIVVLDEPTSAMDPWAETQWLDRFSKMVCNRTAVVITHRFTAAMRADYIYLMKQGQITEAGTHDELLAEEGLYARAWAEQIQNPSKMGSRETELT